MLQILVQFARTYLRKCPGTKFFEFKYLYFLFSLVGMFQCSFNFESSLKFFSAEFLVKFSFSCLTWENFSGRLSFNFTFISWEVSCLYSLKYLSAIQEASDETHQLVIFSCLYSWSPNSYFCLILVLFLGKLLACLKYLSAIQEAIDETHHQANFSCLYSWSPNSY